MRNPLRKYFGPSTLVTAAFIGPGTLTVCTISGASYGYSLLWVLLFATISTIILQEMAARLGLVTQQGLGESIRLQIQHKIFRIVSLGLIFIAIIIGNAAYEAGNISGAALGLNGVFGASRLWPLLIGLISLIILLTGSFKTIERILISMVVLMSVVFIITAIIVSPNLSEIASGLFIPTINSNNQLAILGLIGTTVVPYNLFLHASSVQQKWKNSHDLSALRKENMVAIGLGGLISMAIVITSASTVFNGDVSGIREMAMQLEPLLGPWARYFLALGLFAAGISSAITAPLAAAYTAKGIFGWDGNEKEIRFRITGISILLVGTLFSMLGYKPVKVIQLAQIANGVLLPVVVFFLVYICNKKDLLNRFVNKSWQNALAVLVIMVSLIISFRSLNGVFNFI